MESLNQNSGDNQASQPEETLHSSEESQSPEISPNLNAPEEVKQYAPEMENPPLQGSRRQAKWLSVLAVVVLVGVLLASGIAYGAHLGPFASPATTTLANLASLPCNAGPVVQQLTDTAPVPSAATFAQTQHTYAHAPALSIDLHKVYCVGLNTTRGLMVLELDPSLAPNTVNNFVFLAQHHFYDGITFHRVVPGFVIQTGDPTGTGTGGPGYQFNDEPVKGDYTPGCVAMANGGPNTNGSQFFICTGNDSALIAKQYNLFGHVVLGMNVAYNIHGPGDDPASKSIAPDHITHVTLIAVNAPTPTLPAASPTPTLPAASPTPTISSALANTCFLDPSGPSVPAVYEGNATPTSGPATAPKLNGTPVVLQDGLQYVDIKEGSGPTATNGSRLTVNYTGWVAQTCQKFDSSYDPHGGLPVQPFVFQLGEQEVIQGWEKGIVGMRVGGIRRLYIPAALAYGPAGAQDANGNQVIPPNADLIFDVQLVAVQ